MLRGRKSGIHYWNGRQHYLCCLQKIILQEMLAGHQGVCDLNGVLFNQKDYLFRRCQLCKHLELKRSCSHMAESHKCDVHKSEIVNHPINPIEPSCGGITKRILKYLFMSMVILLFNILTLQCISTITMAIFSPLILICMSIFSGIFRGIKQVATYSCFYLLVVFLILYCIGKLIFKTIIEHARTVPVKWFFPCSPNIWNYLQKCLLID